ncbi:MAG: DUF1501 domain-containing protein [Verrucomicrobia bacterium]|nr:MAG: DUF1501 domain-containing protein [Verrucomicrobiota bacterium]
MATNAKPNGVSVCPGPIKRREFLRIGLSGFASLSLPGLFQLRALAASEKPKARTAVILVWLRGGASHLETYDPKPDAPIEFRGVFSPISTRVPGMQICELLPRHAKIADKFTLLRSMAHTGGGHPAGSLQMLSGDPDPQDKDKPIFPDWMTVANFLRADHTRPQPTGSAYVNPAYGPFTVNGDPNDPHFEVQNIGFKDQAQGERLSDRLRLKQSLDRLDRAVDQSGTMRAIDDFEAQALSLLTSPAARDAFDLSREPDRIRDLYGRNQWGQQCLMARRLVEAGVEIITTTFDGPLCGRVANWDDHAVNHHVFDALKFRAPYFDQAVSALIEDLYARGLDKRVLVIVTGEFGRTPRIQPGRDHWPRAFSQLWAGGGIKTGGVIGATDKHGEEVVTRMCTPGDFLATIYRHLGIDAGQITIPDFSGRPNLILPRGAPIPELERQS